MTTKENLLSKQVHALFKEYEDALRHSDAVVYELQTVRNCFQYIEHTLAGEGEDYTEADIKSSKLEALASLSENLGHYIPRNPIEEIELQAEILTGIAQSLRAIEKKIKESVNT